MDHAHRDIGFLAENRDRSASLRMIAKERS
jgi:hypothetical protein